MFWKKNIQAFTKHHPHHETILKKLKNVQTPENLEPYETQAGDIGIVYNQIPLHAPTGAVAEAEAEVQHNCRPALDRAHLILGLGLGYLLEATFKRSPGAIVVYEPNLPLLKFVLDNVDLSEYLQKRRVRIVTDLPSLLEVLTPLLICFEPIDFLSSGGYALLLQNDIAKIMHQIANLVDDRKRDYRTARYFHNQWIKQFFENLPHVSDCLDMNSIQGKGKGRPAIIISRGPSLDAALPAIKQLENQAVLVAVGGALHHLYKYDITPDFATFLDSRGMKEQLHGLPESYLQKITFLMSGFTQPYCYEQDAAAKIRYTLQSDRPYAEWLSKQEPRVHDYRLLDGCGTVSHIALQAGMIMDCDPVIVIGQDLAFPNDQVYAGGEALKTNGKGVMILEKRDDLFTGPSQMTTLEGQNGEQLQTLTAFKGFVRYFEKTALANQKKTRPQKLYNASLGGAKINGYELRAMDTFIGEWQDFRTPGWLSDQLTCPPETRQKTLEKLQTKLRKLKAEIYECVALLDELIVAGVDTPNNPQLVRFLAGHYLISHFLVLDMIDTRQKYNPVAETPEEIEQNKQGMAEGYKKHRKFLHDDILPWLIQAETRILEKLNPSLAQRPAKIEA
ncbi:motility associated factor glycosyltransferase family protein [Vampirovibrio sp.]|uniref:motility associated factor glycosyltransferase family protein n=1 Tax=Vampirovibrio sp. TaxID=2717857 RepID=UPI003593937C